MEDLSVDQEAEELVEVELLQDHLVEESHVFVSSRQPLETVEQVDEALVEVDGVLLVLVPHEVLHAVAAGEEVLSSDESVDDVVVDLFDLFCEKLLADHDGSVGLVREVVLWELGLVVFEVVQLVACFVVAAW